MKLKYFNLNILFVFFIALNFSCNGLDINGDDDENNISKGNDLQKLEPGNNKNIPDTNPKSASINTEKIDDSNQNEGNSKFDKHIITSISDADNESESENNLRSLHHPKSSSPFDYNSENDNTHPSFDYYSENNSENGNSNNIIDDYTDNQITSSNDSNINYEDENFSKKYSEDPKEKEDKIKDLNNLYDIINYILYNKFNDSQLFAIKQRILEIIEDLNNPIKEHQNILNKKYPYNNLGNNSKIKTSLLIIEDALHLSEKVNIKLKKLSLQELEDYYKILTNYNAHYDYTEKVENLLVDNKLGIKELIDSIISLQHKIKDNEDICGREYQDKLDILKHKEISKNDINQIITSTLNNWEKIITHNEYNIQNFLKQDGFIYLGRVYQVLKYVDNKSAASNLQKILLKKIEEKINSLYKNRLEFKYYPEFKDANGALHFKLKKYYQLQDGTKVDQSKFYTKSELYSYLYNNNTYEVYVDILKNIFYKAQQEESDLQESIWEETKKHYQQKEYNQQKSRNNYQQNTRNNQGNFNQNTKNNWGNNWNWNNSQQNTRNSRSNQNTNEDYQKSNKNHEEYSKKDFYKILGVSSLNISATPEQITEAYRKAALKWHPNRHPEKNPSPKKESEAKFKEIGRAYEILEDQVTRKVYDRYWHEHHEKK